MQPQEKWPPRRFLEPIQSMGDTLTSFPIYQTNVFLLERLGGKSIVVKIKASRQSPTAIEHKGTHHCGRSITALFEGFCNGAELRIEWLPGEVLHAVLKRICSGQNSGMGRPSQRDLRNRALE